MDLLAQGTCVPAVTARGAIVEKGLRGRKAIGEYLNSSYELQASSCKRTAFDLRLAAYSLREALALAFAPRWRCASNRHTPVATETLRLLTLPAIGRFTR